jgi:hypothetical protein
MTLSNEERQAIIDNEHLRVLSICYYVSAGMNAFFSLFGLLYAFMGLMVTAAASQAASQPSQQAPPAFIAAFFGLFGIGIFSVMVVLAVLKFIAARRLSQRRARTLCMIVAGVTCFGIPVGTVLGVFTFLVLSRPSVEREFDAQASPAAPAVGQPGIGPDVPPHDPA